VKPGAAATPTPAPSDVAGSAPPAPLPSPAAAVPPQAPAVSGPSSAVLIVASPSDPSAARQDSTVLRQLDEPSATATPGTPPSLGAEINVPGRTFPVTLTVTVNTDPRVDAALVMHLRFNSPPDAVGSPSFRDRKEGEDMPLQAEATRAGDVFTIRVPSALQAAAGDGFRHRPWLAFPILLHGQQLAYVVLNLNGNGCITFQAWRERYEGAPRPVRVSPTLAQHRPHDRVVLGIGRASVYRVLRKRVANAARTVVA